MKKTILITGSTDGIGKLAAQELAVEGHQVLVHGRNKEKLEELVVKIKQSSRNDDVYGYCADLSDLPQIDQMCLDIKSKFSTLDVLINNAGVFLSKETKNAAGLDVRIAVNYIAPYYLTKQLIDMMQGREDARIINVGSAAQASVSMDVLTGT